MEINATAKYIRVSPRKLALLARSFPGQSPEKAINRLKFMRQSGARDLRDVITSAFANAKQKNVNLADLMIKSINVLPAGAMKRFRAVSRGMAHTYKKRMSHIRVVLTDEHLKSAANRTQRSEIKQNIKTNVENENMESQKVSSKR